MQSTCAKEDIDDKISKGCLVEARTLLTVAGNLTAQERDTLEQTLCQVEQETDRLLGKAEELEQAGSVIEAKALYEQAALRMCDSPSIQAHIKRMNESLLLTRAIKKRGQRLRETTADPAPKPAPTQKLAFILALMGCMGIVLFLFMGRQKTPQPLSGGAEIQASTPVKSPPQTSPVVEENAAPHTSASAEPQQPPAPPSPQLAAASPQIEMNKPSMYTVMPGDSLSLIADKHLCNQQAWRAIFELNRHTLDDPSKLQPGMVLLLPETENRCKLLR